MGWTCESLLQAGPSAGREEIQNHSSSSAVVVPSLLRKGQTISSTSAEDSLDSNRGERLEWGPWISLTPHHTRPLTFPQKVWRNIFTLLHRMILLLLLLLWIRESQGYPRMNKRRKGTRFRCRRLEFTTFLKTHLHFASSEASIVDNL